MAVAALVAWVANVLLGLTVLAMWLRRRNRATFPVNLVSTHLATASIGLGLWIAFMANDCSVYAWSSFVVLNVANGLGDAILTGRWRVTAGTGPSWLKDYGHAVLEVLKGRRPANALLHAFFAGVTYATVLVTCMLDAWNG